MHHTMNQFPKKYFYFQIPRKPFANLPPAGRIVHLTLVDRPRDVTVLFYYESKANGSVYAHVMDAGQEVDYPVEWLNGVVASKPFQPYFELKVGGVESCSLCHADSSDRVYFALRAHETEHSTTTAHYCGRCLTDLVTLLDANGFTPKED